MTDERKAELLNLTAQTAHQQTQAALKAQLDVDQGVVGKALLECLKHVRDAIAQGEFRASVKKVDLGVKLEGKQGQMLQAELRKRGFSVRLWTDEQDRDPAAEAYVIEWTNTPTARTPHGPGQHLLESRGGAQPS